MMSTKKIGLIKMGSFSHINQSVFRLLQKEFPDFQVEVIDIFSKLIQKRDLFKYFFLYREYGIDVLLGRKEQNNCLTRTPYIFKQVRNNAINYLSLQKYVFTFQTQSIFDVSLPKTPHFLYTDHTHLAKLSYPIFSQKDLYSSSWIALEKTIYQNATLNFTMSSNISKSMIEQYLCPPNKVRCIYAGNNVEVSEKGLNDERYDSQNIIFVGMKWERKGGPQLVEAFKTVLKTYPQAQLTIVGCSPQLNIPNCNVVGEVPLSQVGEYYKKASIFCLPTRLEPFGVVFLEAFAYKLPVIATNIGAIPDFVLDGETGYLVEPNDTQNLAEKIIELIGKPNRCKAFGEAGAALVKKRYNWSEVGRKIRESVEHFI